MIYVWKYDIPGRSEYVWVELCGLKASLSSLNLAVRQVAMLWYRLIGCHSVKAFSRWRIGHHQGTEWEPETGFVCLDCWFLLGPLVVPAADIGLLSDGEHPRMGWFENRGSLVHWLVIILFKCQSGASFSHTPTRLLMYPIKSPNKNPRTPAWRIPSFCWWTTRAMATTVAGIKMLGLPHKKKMLSKIWTTAKTGC